jgi:hypothetical protein
MSARKSEAYAGFVGGANGSKVIGFVRTKPAPAICWAANIGGWRLESESRYAHVVMRGEWERVELLLAVGGRKEAQGGS